MSAVVPSRICTRCGERLDRRTFPFQRLDLPFHLQEDGQDREDRRVHVGAVTRGTRVLPCLRNHTIEGLPVLLPQGAAVVPPVVPEGLVGKAVRRGRAAPASPW